MRRLAELDHRRSDLHPAAGGQVVAADVEIDIDLVAGQGPALALAGDGRGCSRVHQGDLRLWIRAAVGSVAAATGAPRVALEPVIRVEPGLGQNLPLVLRRPAGDQLHGPTVAGRFADIVEALLETGQLGVLQHARILPGR